MQKPTDLMSMSLLFLISGVLGSAVPASGSDALLAKFEKSIQETRTVQATLTQARYSPLLEEPILADGKLWLRRPGDVRIEYEYPEPTTLLKTGDTTWLYVPALEQVQKSRASESGIPIEWVLGSSLDEITQKAMISVEGDEIVLRPLPKSKTIWKKITLAFVDSNAFPDRLTIGDSSGELVEIRLTKLRRNLELAAKYFEPRWPDGVDIISLGE